MARRSTPADPDAQREPSGQRGMGAPRRDVVARIVTAFESRIYAGDLKTGDRIPAERELAKEFGLSRTTVREAMYELELKSLVERTPGRGTVVVDLTHRQYMSEALLSGLAKSSRLVAELLDFRAAVEPAIAARAARYATPADIAAMHSLLEEMAQSPDAASDVELAESFHQLLAQATHNQVFVSVYQQLAQSRHVMTEPQKDMSPEKRRKLLVDGHAGMVAAVAARDPERASQLAAHHVESLQREVHAILTGAVL